MSNPFLQTSRTVANEFLQNIVFIDDKAFTDDATNNEFDALKITSNFAKSKKICAVYKPETESDIDVFAQIAKKADITVVDWRIKLEESDEHEDGDEDADEDDPRGPHTRKIIREILLDPVTGANSLKLILIYTGEIDLQEITDAVYDDLVANGVSGVQKGNFEVSTENVRIIIIAKPAGGEESGGGEPKFKHNPELNARVVSYENLPNFILDRFTEMTAGLVSNVALTAITNLRLNNFKILKVYNKHLDPAFLAHRAMLPVPDDASELLKETIINSFYAILDYSNIDEICTYKSIKNWLQTNTFTEQELKIQSKILKLNVNELQKWQRQGFKAAIGDIWKKQFPRISLEPSNIGTKYKDLHKNWNDYFVPTSSGGNRHEEFSILTHQKSNFANPNYIPKLTMGTIVQGKKDGKFWICIQQKCDCVRINPGEARRFLFLPLDVITQSQKHFDFLFDNGTDYTKLKIDYNSHKIKTIKFNGDNDGVVKARKFGVSPNYFFHPIYFKSKSNSEHDQNYRWILDLKDSHAQRVANRYASQLSRIGLDESEWLRRWATRE